MMFHMFLMEDCYHTGYRGLKGKTCNEICDTYVGNVLKRYGEGTTIVFDGYNGKPSMKDTTHVRRTNGKKGISVHFAGEMKLNIKKNESLTNLENKQRFLEMLVIKMDEAKLDAIQCRHSYCSDSRQLSCN